MLQERIERALSFAGNIAIPSSRQASISMAYLSGMDGQPETWKSPIAYGAASLLRSSAVMK